MSFLHKTFGRHRLKRRDLLIAGLLLALFVAIHYVAYWLRYEGQLADALPRFATTVGWVALAKLLVFGWFGVYQGWGRYVAFHDLVKLVQAASIASLLTVVADYLFFPAATVPRSVFLMDWGATIVVIGGLRSAVRVVEEHAIIGGFLAQGQEPVLIVGANDSGEALLSAIRRNFKLSYRVIGFITEDSAQIKACIAGVPVIGMLEETCQLAERHGVSKVLMTAGELSGQQVRQLVDDGNQFGVTVKVLPSYEQLLRGDIDLRPREVSIEDLLRRDPVKLNIQELCRWVNDRVLMVTGSAGSIGSEICRQLLQLSPRKLVLVDQSETGQFFLEREMRRLMPQQQIEVCVANICDAARMDSLFWEHRPDIVFHAAAYKHVPLMEANPSEAVKTISMASRLLADIADKHQVKSFVMISTDKAVNPTSVMGTCKRVAELYVQALASESKCRFVTVRFGNVLDSAGSVIPIFREQIAAGGPVTVTHPEMRRYFMTIPEASQLVIQAGAMGKGGEIFVLDMGEPVRILDLARDMIRLSGLRVDDDIEIKTVGARAGEKLFEELHFHTETHVATSHAKITVAQCERTSLDVMAAALDSLAEIVEGPHDILLARLNELVPRYHGEIPHTETNSQDEPPQAETQHRRAA